MSARMIQMERVVDAPPERVYRAWSDVETVRQWLASSVEGSLLPGARSVLVFPRHRIEVDVLEAEPNSRFRFRWTHPGEDGLPTEVTVTIRPTGYGSTVTLRDGPAPGHGKLVDVERISHVRPGGSHLVKTVYRPATCGTHVLSLQVVNTTAEAQTSVHVGIDVVRAIEELIGQPTA